MFIAAIGILVPSDRWGLSPWKWVIFGLIALALIGLTIQLLLQSREDHDREEKDKRRDEKHEGLESKLTQIAQLVSRGTQQALSSEMGSNLEMQPPVDFDANKHFLLAYQSGWTADVEKRIKVAAARNKSTYPSEEFYAKFIGVGLVAYMHDITWAYIWRSQFLMLAELNRNGGLLPVIATKTFYDRAVIEFPENYKNYSFKQWLAFMAAQGLTIHHPSDMLEITIRGRDFLSYSAHHSRFAEGRKG